MEAVWIWSLSLTGLHLPFFLWWWEMMKYLFVRWSQVNEAGTVIQGQAATHLLMVHQKEDHPLWVTLGSPSTTMLMVRCQEQMSSMAGDPRENGTKFHHTSGRRQWHPTPVLLSGKSHGWRSLVGCSPWGHEESDTTERLHFHFSLSCTGEGNGNPLQCSCLENPRDGGAWWAAVYGVA